MKRGIARSTWAVLGLTAVVLHVAATSASAQIVQLPYMGSSPPNIDPGTGTYAAPVTVTLERHPATEARFGVPHYLGYDLRYTLDGTESTVASTLYTAPFTIITGTTVKAKQFDNWLKGGARPTLW